MGRRSTSAGAMFARFVLWVVGSVAAISALGYLPTRSFARDGAVEAMFGALAAVALASIIGGVPIFMAQWQGTVKPQVVLISMFVRLVAVVLLASAVALTLDLPMPPFLTWLALAYLLLLVVDTRYATGALRDLAGPSSQPPPAG